MNYREISKKQKAEIAKTLAALHTRYLYKREKYSVNGKGFQKERGENGITLIALVVTIIVLLLLAGVSISVLTGQNGILNRAGDAKTKTDLAQIEEQVNLKILEQITLAGENAGDADIEKILNDMGVDYIPIVEGGNVTDIEIIGSTILNTNDNNAKIEVKYIGEEDYYIIQNGKYYKVEKNGAGIKIAQTPTNVEAPLGTITATSSDDGKIKIGKIKGKEILLTTGTNGGSATITVKYGESITKTYNISVIKKPDDGANPILINGITDEDDLTFDADFGRVEVVWLKDKTNEIAEAPNVPRLKAGEADPNPLKPVTWDYYEFGYKLDDKENVVAFTTLEKAQADNSGAVTDEAGNIVQWKENTEAETEAKTTWYNYKAGRGTEDNNSSQWANAKMRTGGVDSYYVWIPRFAYRITYYADEESNEVLGCWDGHGLYDAKTGELNLKNDEGIETTEGGEYIVHPAFGTNLDLGGWYDDDGIDDDGLTGFWVAKYEMSKSDATKNSAGSGSSFTSRPSVINAGGMNIGQMYANSKSIDGNKESHLMKNSEWGAVALLTHSQYGRNGNEIYINNSKKYVKGNSGDTKDAKSSNGENNSIGIVNEYNTKTGVKASTTGNIYGIYDMSGGAWEYVAAFDGDSTSTNLTNYGEKMITDEGVLNSEYDAENNASVPKYISTKYITVYRNGSSDEMGRQKLFEVSKLGDAIKEVRMKSSLCGWFTDSSHYGRSSRPFFRRGGYCGDGRNAGLFQSYDSDGCYATAGGFRAVLSALAL